MSTKAVHLCDQGEIKFRGVYHSKDSWTHEDAIERFRDDITAIAADVGSTLWKCHPVKPLIGDTKSAAA